MEINVRLTLLPLYPRRRISKNPWNKRFNETRCKCGCTGEDKYPSPPLWFKSFFLHIIASALLAQPWRFIKLLGITLLYSVPILSFPLARQLSGNVLVDVGFPFRKVTVLGETNKQKPFSSLYNIHETYVNWHLSVLWDSMQGLSWNSVSLPKQWSPNLAPLTGQSSVAVAVAVTRRHPNERTLQLSVKGTTRTRRAVLDDTASVFYICQAFLEDSVRLKHCVVTNEISCSEIQVVKICMLSVFDNINGNKFVWHISALYSNTCSL